MDNAVIALFENLQKTLDKLDGRFETFFNTQQITNKKVEDHDRWIAEKIKSFFTSSEVVKNVLNVAVSKAETVAIDSVLVILKERGIEIDSVAAKTIVSTVIDKVVEQI